MNSTNPFFKKFRTFDESCAFLMDAYVRTCAACAENVEDGMMSIDTAQSCVEKLATCLFILNAIANEESLKASTDLFISRTNSMMLDNAE